MCFGLEKSCLTKYPTPPIAFPTECTILPELVCSPPHSCPYIVIPTHIAPPKMLSCKRMSLHGSEPSKKVHVSIPPSLSYNGAPPGTISNVVLCYINPTTFPLIKMLEEALPILIPTGLKLYIMLSLISIFADDKIEIPHEYPL